MGVKNQIEFIFIFCLSLLFLAVNAQEIPHYTGETLNNPDYHHGQLAPVVGVHNIQVMRANREFPDLADGYGWTYNHAPMLAYWNNTFFLEYLSDPVGEHIAPGQTFLVTSKDGYNWSKPEVFFPPYPIPDGTKKDDGTDVAKDLMSVNHQRMGFYVSSGNRLFVLAYIAISMNEKDSPNDGNGIGRVVREIYKDGTWGPIYFIRYNHGWNKKNTDYPFYTKSKDKGLKKACEEMLANPLVQQQWNEEADRDDPLIPIQKDLKAFCYYHLPDGNVVGLWKHALTAVSEDQGHTWTSPVRAPGFVNSNAKIWGQRTSDDRYATVYNPSDFRWPLAVSVSEDGLDYKNLLLVNGDISTMRYGGNYKSYGPQYVRGIQETNGTPPDGNLWVTYSMNKEDIWVSEIPVPIKSEVLDQADDDFTHDGFALDKWNIFSPVWARVEVEKDEAGKQCLTLHDKDPFDYATATRLFPQQKNVSVGFSIKAEQNDHGMLQIELQDDKNTGTLRLIFDSDGYLKHKAGYRLRNIMQYKPGKVYDIRIEATMDNRFYDIYVNGDHKAKGLCFEPVHEVQSIVFRTGEVRRFPNVDTPTDQDFDVDQDGKPDNEAVYRIYSLKTKTLPVDHQGYVLDVDNYKHYVDYFNRMEDENIVQLIPNSESWDWMKANIPLFECPQDNFNEMFYFRWWTLRKHIEKTPAGYAITEFLVQRSYADKYNLISCALGHHTYESRWLLDKDYVKQNLKVWYRGNDGKPMNKLNKFSSWMADAVYNYYLLTKDSAFIADMLPDLEADYRRWETERCKPTGMFWQEDVKDGMEEQISGGRKVKNERPTINSYMYGNAVALSKMAKIAGNKEWEVLYSVKADTLRRLVQENLWNPDANFFETVKENDGFANVREEIGFIPWYFNLPQQGYESAWKQITDPNGFLAPFGITTAEQRHPEFRTHGCCKCEWDGAVWPFATSQTLTGLANLLNNYDQNVVNDSVYFDLLETYVESQYYRGRPYIGEYLDELTGYWLKGDQERSRYYNHSTFNDLIITGLVGLRPRADDKVEVNPLIPQDKWDWFCLDRINYHGKNLTIIWDKTGEKYKFGKGLIVLIDGKEIGRRSDLGRLVCDMEK